MTFPSTGSSQARLKWTPLLAFNRQGARAAYAIDMAMARRPDADSPCAHLLYPARALAWIMAWPAWGSDAVGLRHA